jgi:two-component system, LytTR family, sensor kinase
MHDATISTGVTEQDTYDIQGAHERDERDDPRVLWPLIVLFWIVNIALTTVQVYVMAQTSGRSPRLLGLLVFMTPSFMVWFASVPLIVRVLTRRFSFSSGRLLRSGAVHLVASVVIGLATQVVDTATMLRAEPAMPFLPTLLGMARVWILWAMFTYWFFIVMVLAVRHYTTSRARQQRATELAAAVAKSQLAVLRTQLHPHFLFNALNSISSLVFDEPREAQRMIAQLAELLRATLDDGGLGSWPLRRELELLERYTAIEQVRFGDRLGVQIQCDAEALEAIVPSLLLQPLVENAILHGIQPSITGGTVRIAARRDGRWLHLVVDDDGVGFHNGATNGRAERVGLSNSRERLEKEFGDDQALEIAPAEGSGTEVQIRIPWSTGEAMNGAGA